MTPDEVQYLLSAPNANAGYASASTVYNSNGNYVSTTQVDVSVAQNNLFPDLTGPQNAAQQVDYQCVFVYNSDPSVTMVNSVAWIPSNTLTSNAISWAIAADPTGVSNYNTTSQQALLISNPQVAPAGIATWIAPGANFSTGAALGTIGPRQVYPIWIRRTATGAASTGAGFTLYVTFDI